MHVQIMFAGITKVQQKHTRHATLYFKADSLPLMNHKSKEREQQREREKPREKGVNI